MNAKDLPENPKIVALGGGTGLATLLYGLKRFTANTTAIVTVADDGGSSGRLRRELSMLPPGDIRNCLIALADEEAVLTRLLKFRFESGDLSGHSFGNLFMAALTRVTGDFEEAVRLTGEFLSVRGAVVPVSLEQVSLRARINGGAIVEGQAHISHSGSFCEEVFLQPQDPDPNPRALLAIEEADMIVLGPGSLFTSVIPAMLFTQVEEKIAVSAAPKVMICNVMTQPGETGGFSASDHLEALLRHAGANAVDTVLVNTAMPPEKTITAYRHKGAEPVVVDVERLSGFGKQILSADVGFAQHDYFRHDSARLATAVMSLLGVHRR